MVAIIALMIILYILFLPPEQRADILGGDGGTPIIIPGEGEAEGEGEGESDEKILLLENPGLLSIQGDDRIHHILPRIKLFEESSGVILDEYNTLTTKRSLFNNQPKLLVLVLEDSKNTKNILIDFNVIKSSGDLVIKFNDEIIYEGYSFKFYSLPHFIYEGFSSQGIVGPINVKSSLLKQNNLIEFSVSSPGLKFWKRNEYYLEKIKFVATIADVSHLVTKTKFYVSKDELDSAKKMELKFNPRCDQKKVGALTIEINDNEVYQGSPSCNVGEKFEFSHELIKEGDNNILFSTTKGEYLISHMDLSANVEKREDYAYYFSMDEDYFKEVKEQRCGDVDGECISGCDEDEDIDCCFAESNDNFWCDIETDDMDDRCVSAVDEAKCSRCLTGYEDDDGDSAEACNEMCGDDTDDECPDGCNINYDKDCCYEDDDDNYWCDEVPVTGITSVCEVSVTSGECDDCYSGYEDGDSDEPEVCEEVSVMESKLRSGYRVLLDFKLLDDDNKKEFELSMNGKKDLIVTKKDSVSRDISSKVIENYNTLRIKPEKSVEIAEIKVTVEQK